MMKQTFTMMLSAATLLTCVHQQAKGQIISNPDVEIYTTCPTTHSIAEDVYNPAAPTMQFASGWLQTTDRGTSDYLNTCGYSLSVPPYSGSGYIGLYLEQHLYFQDKYKEYATNILASPLVSDVKYTISFKVARFDGSVPGFAASTATALPQEEKGYFGLLFSNALPADSDIEYVYTGYTGTGPGSILNSFGSASDPDAGRALVPADHPMYGFSASNNWVEVTVEYTAKGGEQYMTVGQFREGSTSLSNGYGVYYFVDDFSINEEILSVKLGDFTANKNKNHVELSWATVTEENNKGFEIERSPDGKSWQSIAFVNSKAEEGNSHVMLDYTFTDHSPFSGQNFYRLKQTDFDGKHEYSPVRLVNFIDNNDVSLYPNPTQDQVTITGLSGTNMIELYDISGKRLRSAENTATEYNINLSDLSDGIYYIRIQQESGNLSTHKILKLK